MSLSPIWPMALLEQLHQAVAGPNLPVGFSLSAEFTEVFNGVYFISIYPEPNRGPDPKNMCDKYLWNK